MSQIPENLEWTRNCTRYLVEIIIYTLFTELTEDGVTALKPVGPF